MIFPFLLTLAGLLFSGTSPEPAAGGPSGDTLSGPGTAPADSALKDSLRQGKAASADSLAPRGRTGLWLGFSFVIPRSPELVRLRSAKENLSVATRMSPDPRSRFDNNDIAFPPEAGFFRRLSETLSAAAGLGFLWIRNGAAWTPKQGDTVFTQRQVNTYALSAAELDLWLRADLPPALLTADRFNRIYLRAGVELFPWARLTTERTELGRSIDARGFGAGGVVAAGLEKYLNPGASLSGELGYAWVRFSKWGVRESDLFTGGRSSPLAVTLRNLQFRFTYTVWRAGT